MKQTTIDSVTITAAGDVEIWLKKRPIDPTSESESVRGGHRFTINAKCDLQAELSSLNAYLDSIGVLPVSGEYWAWLENVCSAAWSDCTRPVD